MELMARPIRPGAVALNPSPLLPSVLSALAYTANEAILQSYLGINQCSSSTHHGAGPHCLFLSAINRLL
jgi:hypothetical protein